MRKYLLALTFIFAVPVPKIPHYWYEFKAFCKELSKSGQNKFIINDIIQAKVEADPAKGSIILIVPVGRGVGECKFAKVNSNGSWDYCDVDGKDCNQWWNCVSRYTNFRKYGPEIQDKVKALFGVSEIIKELDPEQIYLDSETAKFVEFKPKYGLWMYKSQDLTHVKKIIEQKIKELIGANKLEVQATGYYKSLDKLYIEEAIRNITDDLSFTVKMSGQGEKTFHIKLPNALRTQLQTGRI